MADKNKKVAKVTHYFDKIGVAVLEVSATIKVGDRLKFITADGEFDQIMDSMQVEHQNVQEAAAGDKVGAKVEKPVKEGDEVFKIS